MRLDTTRTPYTLYCSSYHPKMEIAEIIGQRRAQIVAKLMAERFPGLAFGYAPSPVLAAPNTNHFLKIGANTFEVQRLTEQELADEVAANPHGREKWLMFIFDNGAGPDGGPQCAAYLEHDYPVVKRCMADPTLVKTFAIYGPLPDTATLEAKMTDWMRTRGETGDAEERFNCLGANQRIADFSAFFIAPCRNDQSQSEISGQGETETVQCAPDAAEFWTIYGSEISINGCAWLAVHDAYSVTEIVRIARQINLETGKPFFYRDETHGCIPQSGARLDFMEIAAALTEAIHDDLPDLQAGGVARIDDFEAHPLAEMREAFILYAETATQAAAVNPYHPWEKSA